MAELEGNENGRDGKMGILVCIRRRRAKMQFVRSKPLRVISAGSVGMEEGVAIAKWDITCPNVTSVSRMLYQQQIYPC